MTKEASLGKCPDCGQEYKDPDVVIAPLVDVAATVEATTIPWAEYAAQTHQDYECPVQKERELVAGLEAALRYFGIADTMAKLGEVVNANQHDSEILWGDAERWFKKEAETIPAPATDSPEGRAQTGGVRKFPMVVPPAAPRPKSGGIGGGRP